MSAPAMLPAALRYARRGWRVLPCIPGEKRPLLNNWPALATTDADVLNRWWKRTPAANVGIATGAESGLLVLDLDGDPRELLSDRTLPTTPAQRTGGGGYQLFYRFPAALAEVATTRAGVLPSVDTRGRSGFVVAPPSLHPSGGRYRWCDGYGPGDVPLAPPPAWLVDALDPAPRTTPPAPLHLPVGRVHGPRYVAAAIERECAELARTPEGRRNEALNRAAFALARFVAEGLASPEPVICALAYAAAAAGLKEREISRTIESAFRAREAAA
ncbi:MAG TPA: bifunctional DNA primase/polymerase [Longimicrobiaceae bacterium]|nr:bifunctional DNA primase/polymerase [Longimicrobiaceae bacterium]